MYHLVAKVDKEPDELYKVLSTSDEIFDSQDLTQSVEYTPAYKLDEEEWFKLSEFKQLGFKNSFIELSNPIDTTQLNQLSKRQFKHIKYLSYESGDLRVFQKLLPSCIMSKKWFDISDAPSLKDDKAIITINKDPDAIYHINDDVLYFKDVARIKSLFKGIDSIYREATDAEVKDFLNQDFINLADNFTAKRVKVANRKRIALVTDTLSGLTEDQRKNMFEYIHEYCSDVQYENGVFEISSEDKLKKVLYGIEQRYYTTKFGNEKRLANSVLTLP